MNRSENIGDLATALAKAQGVMEAAKKESENPYFESTYADLAAVWDACRKPLSVNGLSVVQLVNVGPDGPALETVLMHTSGQWLSSHLSLHPKDNGPQSMGSAITYARRYSLGAMVGVAAEEDDDGESAQGRGQAKPQKKEPDTKNHYCEKHKVNFFMTGKMKSYAHPVSGTKDWCYEPTEKPVQAEQAVKIARPEATDRAGQGRQAPAAGDSTTPQVPPPSTPAPAVSPPAPAPGKVPVMPSQDEASKFWGAVKGMGIQFPEVPKILGMEMRQWLGEGRTFDEALKLIESISKIEI